MRNLDLASQQEAGNFELWRLMAAGYSSLNDQGMTSLARAEMAALRGQRAEARFFQPADRLIGQNALLFALRSALGDTGEYRAEGGRQRVIIGASGEQGHCQFLIHEVRRYLLASVHDGPPAGRKWE